ncbi:MAG: PAS domain S-box protein [Chloroflexota bacterium]
MSDTVSRKRGKGSSRPAVSRALDSVPLSASDSALVAELSQRALTQSNVAIVMQDACELVRERLGTEFVKTLELVPSGEGLLLTAGVGWKPGYVGQVVVPLIRDSHAGYTMQEGEPILVEDLRTEKRFRGMPFLMEHGIVSGVSTILQDDEYVFGIMTAHTAQKRKFTPEDVAFLTAVARAIASSLHRRDTERALRESDERLRLAMDAGGMGTWEWDLRENEVVWSDTLERIHGLEPGEFDRTPASFFGFVHPEDHDEVEKTITAAMTSGYHEMEYRVLLRDGTTRWLSTRGVLMRDDEGKPARMIGVCMDVTDRKLTEHAVLRAEEQYRAIFENAAFGVFQTTPGGRFLNANQALARILGFASPEEMREAVEDIGEQVHVNPERRAEFARLLLENQEVNGFESQARRKDGRIIWISLTGKARRNPDGSAASFEGMVEDITERKTSETRMAAQYAVTRALAELATVPEAMSSILEAICCELGWAIGQVWMLNRSKSKLALQGQFTTIRDSAIAGDSHGMSFTRGVGLPGRVWEEGRAEWIEEVSADGNFPRAEQARTDGITSGFAFPIRLNRDVIGVMEFFSRERLVKDEDILEAMEAIGSQVGQFIERKRAEDELAGLVVQLEEARERVDNLVSNVPGVVWEAWGKPDDQTQRIDFVSAHVEKMLGYSVEEWVNTPNFWLTIVHPDDKEQAAAESLHTFETGGGTIEFRWMTKDGRAIWVEAQSTVIRDDNGNPLGMRGVTMDITERREAESKIRETEERFSKAFHASPAGLSIVSADERRFIDVNESFLEIIGHTRDEVIGKLVDEVGVWFEMEDRERMAQALSHGEGHARNVEVQLKTGDGGMRNVLGSAEMMQLGGQMCVLSLMFDITERKKAEAALREESEALEALNRIGQMLSAELDLQTLVQAVTDVATSRTGARIGAFFFNQVDEAGETYLLYTMAGWDREAFSTLPMPGNTGIFGPTFRGEEIIRLNDVTQDERFGKTPPFMGMLEGHPEMRSYMAVPVVSRAGKVLGGLFLGHPRVGVFSEREERIAAGLAAQAAIAMDNAQLYEAERVAKAQAVAASERQSFLAEASGILSSTLDYEVTLASVAQLCVPFLADWCAIDLIDGDKLRRMAVVHADPEKLAAALRLQEEYPADPNHPDTQALLKQGKPVYYPEIPQELLYVNTRNEEHRRLIAELGLRSAMAVPLKAGGRTIGCLTLVTAESGRLYSTEDLALAEDLGQRAGLAVDNAMLFQASQDISAELRRANEAKDEFLGLVSHELRTPITTIYGGARLLRTRADTIDEESRASVLEDIEQEAERLHRIVEDLLVLARAELGEEVQTEPVLIQRMVEKTVSAFNKRRPGRVFIVDLQDEMKPVRASTVYLEQILRNLMNNADKYSPAESEIEVRAREGDDEVIVSVMDRGPGIPAEESELIFERFYRSTGTAKSAGGAGIGLTVCRRLIEAQNGRVWAEPREGGGLVVSFALPHYEERA